MNKNKIYLIIIVALVLSHIVLFSLPLINGPKNERPKQTLIRELALSKEQIVAYEQLIDEHKDKVQELRAQMKKERGLKYKDLTLPDSLVKFDRLSALQLQLERVHIRHFMAIRALCSSTQQKKFDALAPRLNEIFFKGPKK